MWNDDSIGVQIPQIFLPRPGIDLTRWAVIACDQYTSQPEYWENVENFVQDAPSTFRLTLPEVFLGTAEESRRIQTIQAAMRTYLSDGTLVPLDGMIYVERSVNGKTRRGLIIALDLERYDFSPGSTSLIRATEGTIVDRLPPRMKIRKDACLELPHILVLIDDPERSVIEPFSQIQKILKPVYDFDLMYDSGHLTGYPITSKQTIDAALQALRHLADPKVFANKYKLPVGTPVLLFAMGDGNHSLATAKAVWEQQKAELGLDHPARYALVEIENVHDEGLVFEPIHRLLFNLHQGLQVSMGNFFPMGKIRFHDCSNCEEMVSHVDHQQGSEHWIGWIAPDGYHLIEIIEPPSNLPVGSLQSFLDDFISKEGADKVDYVHGLEVTCRLGCQPGNAGFYLPAISKGDLFKTVILEGALPRKTFSMGEAQEKRFYMEARQIGNIE